MEQAAEMVRACRRVVPQGGATKWGLADPPPDAAVLKLQALSGVVEYDPGEFTFTARAGTSLQELERVLAREGQYLPFDPPFAGQGATLGGAIAAGLSGPCRLRYGGVRDFVLGVRFIDAAGRVVRGGSRVVKNAAGFDLPKMFCGSRGRLGVLVEATLKVFPRPQAFATWVVELEDRATALQALVSLLRSTLEPHAADLQAPTSPERPSWRLLVRLGGRPGVLAAQGDQLRRLLGQAGERLDGDEERRLWEDLRDLGWAREYPVVLRIPMLPGQLGQVDEWLEQLGALRHYSVGGNVAWAALAEAPHWDALQARAAALGLGVWVVRGAPPGRCRVGVFPGDAFGRRVKQALDPEERFGPL